MLHMHAAHQIGQLLSRSEGDDPTGIPDFCFVPKHSQSFASWKLSSNTPSTFPALSFQWNPVCTVVTISPTIPPDSSLEFVQLCFAGIGWRKNWQKEISWNVHMSWNMLGNWIKNQMKISMFYITDLYHRRGLFNIQNVWTNR